MKVFFLGALLALLALTTRACRTRVVDGGCYLYYSGYSRDDQCPGNQICSRGNNGYNEGSNYRPQGCSYWCCHNVGAGTLPEGDHACNKAGSSISNRDDKCQGNLVCARYGHDNRYYGCHDRHCCTKIPISCSIQVPTYGSASMTSIQAGQTSYFSCNAGYDASPTYFTCPQPSQSGRWSTRGSVDNSMQGWELAARIKSGSGNWWYNSGYWTNHNTFQDGDDVKNGHFIHTSSNAMRIVFETGGESRVVEWHHNWAATLRTIFSWGESHNTIMEPWEWHWIVPSAGYQNNCNRQGVNVHTSRGQARIGIFYNEQNNCDSCDAATGLGFGSNFPFAAGSYVGCCINGGRSYSQQSKASLYILTNQVSSKFTCTPKSCYLNHNRMLTSFSSVYNDGMVYTVECDVGYTSNPNTVDMMPSTVQCGPNGQFRESAWKLALRIDGSAPTFYYDNDIWVNNDRMDDNGERKTDAFFESASKVKIVFDYNDNQKISEFVWNMGRVASLHTLFNEAEWRTTVASAGTWRGMIPDAGVQNYCNRQGVNIQLGRMARIGMIMNQENDCNSPDSAIGIGLKETSAGSQCSCCQNSGSCNRKTVIAAVYVLTEGRSFATHGDQACQRRTCTATSSTFMDGYFTTPVSQTRYGDNVAYVCLPGYSKGASFGQCQSNGKISGQSCTVNTCVAGETLQHQSNVCTAMVASSYDFVHLVSSDSVSFMIKSKGGDHGNVRVNTHSTSVYMNPYTDYIVDVTAIQIDMASSSEKVINVKVNGQNLGDCRGTNPGGDTACTPFSCKSGHSFRTGKDGKVTVELSAQWMYDACRCNGMKCYPKNRDSRFPSFYLTAEAKVKAAGTSSHSTCAAYCRSKGATCADAITAREGNSIGCNGAIPKGSTNCYCVNDPPYSSEASANFETKINSMCAGNNLSWRNHPENCRAKCGTTKFDGECSGNLYGKTGYDENAGLCVTNGKCQELCAERSDCYGVDMYTDKNLCYLNTVNCKGLQSSDNTDFAFKTGGSLALSIDGNSDVFKYDQGIWTNNNKIDSGNNKKTDAFFTKAAKFRFEFEYAGHVKGFSWTPSTPISLHTLMNGGQKQVYITSHSNWINSISSAGVQANCNYQGFNVNQRGKKARIGIVFNEQNDCNSPDSYMGLGLNDISAGSYCSCCNYRGSCNTKRAIARVYAISALSRRQTCAYRCNAGYTAKGKRKCLTGSSQPQGGSCVANVCRSRNAIANVKKECGRFGQMMTNEKCDDWSCADGYKKAGGTRMCLTNGYLSGGRCDPNPCIRKLDFRQIPYSLERSECNDGGGTWHLDYCNFECARGYTPSPSGRVRCSLGDWVKPLPSCKPSSCSIGNIEISNGSIETQQWNLALKIDGSSDAFRYSAAAWTNQATVDDGNNLKTDAFFKNAVSFRVEFDDNGAKRSFTWNTATPVSLYSLMRNGQRQTTLASHSTWTNLISGAGVQANCNFQGFNVQKSGKKARIGIIFNEQNDCNSPDSYMGLGLNEMSAGSMCGCCNYKGSCNNKRRTARVYALNIVSSSLPDQESLEVTCNNEDWQLALQIDGQNSDAFKYDGSGWTSTSLVDDGLNKKTRAYFKATDQIKVQMEQGGRTSEFIWNLGKANKRSLYSLFTSGEWRTSVTSESKWKDMISSAGVQNYCNRQGVNIGLGVRARLGMVMNQENDCNSPDSAIGLGLGNMAAGSHCSCCQNRGSCNKKKAKARVYIKNSGGMRRPSGTGRVLCVKGELSVPTCEKIAFKPVNRLRADVFPLDSAMVVENNCGDMKMNYMAGKGSIGTVKVAMYSQCCNLCTNTESCQFFTFFEDDGSCQMDDATSKFSPTRRKGAMLSTAVGRKAQFLVADVIPNCPAVASAPADDETQCDSVRLVCEKDAACQYVVYSYQAHTCDTYNYCPKDKTPIPWPQKPYPTQPAACVTTGFAPGSGCPGTCGGKTIAGLTELECMDECIDTPGCSQFSHNWQDLTCTLCDKPGVPSSVTTEYYDITGDQRIVYEAPRRSTCTTVDGGFGACTSGDSKYTEIMKDSVCTTTESEFHACPEGVTCPPTSAAFAALDSNSPEASCVAMCDATPGCKFASIGGGKCYLTAQCDEPQVKPGSKVFVSGGFWQKMNSVMPDGSVILDGGNRNNADSRFKSPISGSVTATKIVYNTGIVSCRNCDFARYKTVCSISVTNAEVQKVHYNGARVKGTSTIAFDAVAGGELAIQAEGKGGCGTSSVKVQCTSSNSAWNELTSNTNNMVAAEFGGPEDLGNDKAAFKATFDRACESGDGVWSSAGTSVVLRSFSVMTMDDDCKKPSLSDGTASYWGCGSGDDTINNLATFVVSRQTKDEEVLFPSTTDPRYGYPDKRTLPKNPQTCELDVDGKLTNIVMTPSERHYTYEVTVGREIWQTDNNSGDKYFLGTFNKESDQSKPSDQEFFDNGQGCPGGIKRSSKIKFMCGADETVVSASEPTVCYYEFQISTPTCCKGGVDDPTIGAADSTADKYTIAGSTQLNNELILFGNAKVAAGDEFALLHGMSRGGYGKVEAYVYFWFNGGRYSSLGHEFFLSTSPLKSPTGASMTKPLYSYFDENTKKHFLSSEQDEGGKGIRLEGALGYVFTSKIAGSVPIYEYKNKVQQDRQYTTHVGEFLAKPDYTQTNTIGYAMINADGSEAPPCDTTDVVINDGYLSSCPPSIEHGQTCNFVCNQGFKPEETGKIVCTKGKLHTDDCIAMSCPMDFMTSLDFGNAHWAETTCSEKPLEHQKRCTVTCAFGYHPSNYDNDVLPTADGYNADIFCEYGVRSVEKDPSMTIVYCGPDRCELPEAVGVIPQGVMTCDSRRHGARCVVTCDDKQKVHSSAYSHGRYHPMFYGLNAGGGVSKSQAMQCQNGVIVPVSGDKTPASEVCDWLHSQDSRVSCSRTKRMPILVDALNVGKCREACCKQKGCRAMAFDSSTKVCSMYDQVLNFGKCDPSSTVITNNRGMTCPPNSCDTSRLYISRGRHNCGSQVNHDRTCTATCDVGYHPEFRGSGILNKDFELFRFSGNGREQAIGDIDGNGVRDPERRDATMKCELGVLRTIVCVPDPCYMPVRAARIEKIKSHNCPTRLSHGEECQFKCLPGYHSGPVGGMGDNKYLQTNGIPHGTLKCSLGLTNMQDCIENSCSAFGGMEFLEETDCYRQVYGSTSCRFMCEAGYEPSGPAERVSAPGCQKSRCDLVRKYSTKCDPDYGELNCWDPKVGAQADSGVQYGVLFCDRGVLEEETCVPLTDTDGDGLYDNLFNRPLTVTDGKEYDICPFDANNDEDGDGICGDIDVCPEDPLNDEDGDGWCGGEDSYSISWNFDWVAPNEVGKMPRGFNGLSGWEVEGTGLGWAQRQEVTCKETVLDKDGTRGISCLLDYGDRLCMDREGQVISFLANITDDEMTSAVRHMQNNLHQCNEGLVAPDMVVPLPQPQLKDIIGMDQLSSEWELALKIDGRSDVFRHSAALWENEETYQDGMNEKTASYFKKATEMKLVMDYGDSTAEFIWMHEEDEVSLLEFFKGDEQLIELQSADAWKAMIPDAGVQDNCNRQGINVQIGQKVRIGIVMNQENDCNSPDSALGIGMHSLSAGSFCSCCQNAGTCNVKKAVAALYIKPIQRVDSVLDRCNAAPGYSYCSYLDECVKPENVVCEPAGPQFFPDDDAACEGQHSLQVAVKSPSDIANKGDCASFPDQTCTTFPSSGWFRRYQKEYAKLVEEGVQENWFSDLALPDGMMSSTPEGTGSATSLNFPVSWAAMTFVISGQADGNDVAIELLVGEGEDDEEEYSVAITSKPELTPEDGFYHVEWDLSPVIPTDFGKYRDDYSDEEDGVDIKIRVRDDSSAGSIAVDNFRFFDAVSGCVPECFTIVRGNQLSAGRIEEFSTEIIDMDCTDYGVDEGDCFFLEDNVRPYLMEKVGMEENSGMFCWMDTVPGDYGAPIGVGLKRHGVAKEFLSLDYFPRCLFLDFTDWPKTYIAAENKDEFSDGMVYLFDQQNADLFCYDGEYQDKPQCAFFANSLQVFRRFEGYQCSNHDLLQKEHFDPVTGQNVGSHLLFNGGELAFWICDDQALNGPRVEERDLVRREEKIAVELFTGKPSLDTKMWVENNCLPAGINTNPKYRKFPARSPKECATFCLNNPLCTAFEYSDVTELKLASGDTHTLKNCWTFMDKECDPLFDIESITESADPQQPKDLYLFHNTGTSIASRSGVALIEKQKKKLRKGSKLFKMRQVRPRNLPKRPPLRRLFNAFDSDSSRQLSVEEISAYLEMTTGYKLNENELGILVREVDGNLDNMIKYREFRQLFKRRRLPGNFKDTMKAVRDAFIASEKAFEEEEEGEETTAETEEAVVAVQKFTDMSMKPVFVGGIAILAIVALIAVAKSRNQRKASLLINGNTYYGTDDI